MSINHSEWLEEGDQAGASSGLTAKDKLKKYLSYLPLFIVSLVICIGAGLLYLHYATPKYNISESILIRNRIASPTISNTPANDLLSVALDGNSSMNIDNEIQLLHSVSLMERIVAKNKLNTCYYKLNTFNKTDLYPRAPFRLVQKDSGTGKETLHMKVDGVTKDNIKVTVSAKDLKTVSFDLKWNEPFEVAGSHFVFSPGENDNLENGKYQVDWMPVSAMADDITSDLSVNIPDKKTTIIKLSLLAENVARGKDILNWVVKEYNQSNIEEKNTLAQNTIRFIDDRLNIVTNELSGVEGSLEGFQGSSRLVDVQAQASQSLENTNDISKNISDLQVQERVVDILQSYFNDPAAQNRLVPSNLGINDGTLITLISRYNELQSKRQREAPQLASNSIVLQDMDNQINDVKTSIKENLVNIKKNLQLQEAGHRQKDQEYQGFIAELPRKQRVLQDIKRKQNITEGLYLYLLQKREETAIASSSANAATYKQIDLPKADEKPAEPNRMVVQLGSVLLGLLIPFGLIKMREALNEKVTDRNQVTRETGLPVIGEIGHIEKNDATRFAALQPGTAAEQFRSIRTNISLFSKAVNKQVILVTSAADEEGKSIVSHNLAAVLAMPGKKVALLQFDVRNPAPADNATGAKGLTGFLNGRTTVLSELYKKSAEVPTLHIYPPGTIADNPGDILLHKNMGALFSALKGEYDYIVIDTAAAAAVSDAFVLGRYSDMTLFVVRIGVTVTKQLQFLREIAASEKLQHIGLIINDVKG